jgi:hypothetical protein
MMALDPQLLQMDKILAVSAGRTRRMEQAVASAAIQLHNAQIAFDQANDDCARSAASLASARSERAQYPALEQHRVWLDKCSLDLSHNKQEVSAAQEGVELAQDALSITNQALARQNLRHDRLIETRQTISKAIRRKIEIRVEDDVQHIPSPSLALNGAML